MNANELYESLGAFVKHLCESNENARTEIAKENNLSELQTVSFFQLCGDNHYKTESKSCHEMDKSLEEYAQNQKTISLNSDNIENIVHYKLNSLWCFTSCNTSKQQNIRTVALIVNQWPLKALKQIKKEHLHSVIKRIADIEGEIDRNKKEYLNANGKFLQQLRIHFAINRERGKALTNFIDKLCFKFNKNDINHNKWKEQLLKTTKQTHEAYTSLNIGTFDKSKNEYVENLAYKYYDYSLRRWTIAIIPKTLFNYLRELETKIEERLQEIDQIYVDIQRKRAHKSYTTHLTKDRNEQFRAHRHKFKTDKGNHKRKPLKKKTPKKKTYKKKKKHSNKSFVTNYFKPIDNIDKNECESNSDNEVLNENNIGLHPRSMLLYNKNVESTQNSIQTSNNSNNAGLAVFGYIRRCQLIVSEPFPHWLSVLTLSYLGADGLEIENRCYKCNKITMHLCKAKKCILIVCNICGGWPEEPSNVLCQYHI